MGGLDRVLQCVAVDRLLTPHIPPREAESLEPDGDNGLPKAARNLLRCMDFYARPLRWYEDRIGTLVELAGDRMETLQLTEELRMDILFGEAGIVPQAETGV